MPELADLLTAFAHRLAARGLPADAERIGLLHRAVAGVNPLDRGEVRAASRAVMCTGAAHVPVHDREFDVFFRAPGARTVFRPPTEVSVPTPDDARGAGPEADDGAADTPLVLPRPAASRVELLRHVDLGTSPEAAAALALMDRLTLRRPTRAGHRRTAAASGAPDLRRTVRELARHEELGRLPQARSRPRSRRGTVVADVSASMEQWLPAVLRFSRRTVAELDARAFAAGTRLTPLTAALRGPDGGAAVRAAHRAIPDSAGGTRLGEALQHLLADHRETVRGSVCVIISDGWERGGLDDLDAACERIARLAKRFIWINPRAGRAGFAPAVRGLRIAAAHAHALIPATTVADWQAACDLLALEVRP